MKMCDDRAGVLIIYLEGNNFLTQKNILNNKFSYTTENLKEKLKARLSYPPKDSKISIEAI